MSTLHNPLDKFQSYSIQYVMLACRTTEDAKVFTDESKNIATLNAISQVKVLGDAVPFGNGDTAFLVMDTRRFSQFTIDSLKYDVLINGIEKEGSHGNLSTNVEMTILDSVGVSFINFLQWLMDEKMQTNFDGMIYMLRLIFVGHRPDGVTESVQTITIPMHLFKLELNLDYAKGAYTAEFQPNTNFDTKKHSRWLNIYTASTYFTGVGTNKLGALIDSFETKLNQASSNYYNQATALIKQSRNLKGRFGRQVQYMITIPAEWRDFEFNGGSTANATETVFTKALDSASKTKTLNTPASKPGSPTDTNLAVDAGMQITEVLDIMFRSVKEIADLGNGRKVQGQGGSVTFYKHIVGITSDDAIVTVHVDVVPFRVPNVVSNTKNSAVSQNEADFYVVRDGKRVPKNFAEFNYIFTGQNKDILNFDMKLQDLQWLLASNLDVGVGAMMGVSELGQQQSDGQINKTAELVLSRAYDPLLLPRNTSAELANFSKFASLAQAHNGSELIKSSQDYTRNLSMFYAASPITTVMTIRGNPDIMAKFNMGSFLPHRVAVTNNGASGNSTVSAKTKLEYRQELEQKILADNVHDGSSDLVRDADGVISVKSLGSGNYTTSPVFVAINIHGPSVDFKTNQLVNGKEFSEKILYDNYYVVMKVSNIIEGSTFTQQLELFSHNVFGNGKLTSIKETKKI